MKERKERENGRAKVREKGHAKDRTKEREIGHAKDRTKEREIAHTDKKKKSACPYSSKCGGCTMIDLPMEQQLLKKKT